MQIHLSKPGGQREGPFNVDEINRDLASRKYNDSDYWAWYEGLNSWVPLHSVPGVKSPPPSPTGGAGLIPNAEQSPQQDPYTFTPTFSQSEAALGSESDRATATAEMAHAAVAVTVDYEPETTPSFQQETAETETTEPSTQETFDPSEQPEPPGPDQQQPALTLSAPSSPKQESAAPAADLTLPTAPARESKVFSGFPAEALEQIFVFTSAEGPSVRQSGVVAMMMLEMIGENPDDLRQRVPRDVFGQCNVGERIRNDGKVPGSAWRAMSSLRPEVVERAKTGEYRTCVRTFTTEADDLVAVFLFYNKGKLPREA